jgi:hypothetical protein
MPSYDDKVSECNTKWVIFQLYHGENKLHFTKVYFVLDRQAVGFYSVSSQKQQSAGRHVAPLATHYSYSKPTSLCSQGDYHPNKNKLPSSTKGNILVKVPLTLYFSLVHTIL